jgi:hypothetical protein
MKELLALFMSLTLFASSAAAGVLIFEGNDNRGEPSYPVGGGTAVIDVYAEGLLNVAAIQSGFNFLKDSSNFNSLFQLSKDEGNPKYLNFDYQMIDLGPSIPSGIFPIYTDQRDTAGFMLLAGGIDFPVKTLLYSVTYDYDIQAVGTYIVDINPNLTSIGDPDANPISYTVNPGSITIIPEPGTIVLLGLGFLGLLGQRQWKI